MSNYDGLDYLLDVPFEAKIKKWMGAYFPSVSYCTTARFEHNGCGWRTALTFRKGKHHSGSKAH